MEYCHYTKDNDWVQLCMDSILSDNDNIKPKIAQMMFETYPVHSTNQPKSNLPYDCVSIPGNYVLDDFPLPDQTCNDDLPHHVHVNGKPLDPTINMIHECGNNMKDTPWDPGLNPIAEETIYDLKYTNDCLHYLPTNSRKRRQYRVRRAKQHHAKISASIKQLNGIYRVSINPAQSDTGANRSCTGSKHLLVNFQPIAPYPVNGVNSDGPAIHCTGVGYLPWKGSDNNMLLIRCLYSKDMQGTIISPNDVVSQYINRFSGYDISTDFDSKQGECKFIARDGCSHVCFSTYMENNLWYHYLENVPTPSQQQLKSKIKTIVRQLSDGAAYEVWHHRLGHPGHKIMEMMHKTATGVPKLRRNKFYSCSSCNSAKFRKTHIGPTKRIPKEKPIEDPSIEIGQHLHADFGFVRGSD